MSAAWWVVAPAGESQGSFLNPKVPDHSRIAEADTGTAAYNAWIGNGAYHGWQVVMGPFATRAQARAAHPPAGLNAVLTAAELGATTAAQSALGSGPALPGPTISNPLNFLASIANFFDKLSEASTWLRIGEFILGAGLILVGLAHLASGTAAGKAARTIATKAALL